MNFKLNELDIKKLNDIFKINETNKEQSEFLFDYFSNAFEISKNIKDESLYDLICDYYGLDGLFNINIKQEEINNYLNNPYVKNIKLDNIKEKKYEYLNQRFNRYEGFLLNDIKSDDTYNEIIDVGYFTSSYKYSSLTYDNEIWMLITPHEINTMNLAINNANGNVLVLGLGLGYYAYMISLKDNVNKITIIEKDKKIIDMFNKYILPQFVSKNKIEIINDDGYKYISSDEYDYTFIDIYHDVDDGISHYIKMKQMLNDKSYDFWIESSFIITIRRLLIDLMFEQFNKEDVSYDKSLNIYDSIINSLYEITKDITFDSIDKIINYLSNDNINLLINKIKI